MATTDVNNTLNERGSRYGDFAKHAEISQAFEEVARATPGWARLSPAQKESLKLQWHKQARILNGDPNYADSWVDIAGYAQLVTNLLEMGVSHTDGLKPKAQLIEGAQAPVTHSMTKVEATVSPTPAAPVAPSAQKPTAPAPISPIGTEKK